MQAASLTCGLAQARAQSGSLAWDALCSHLNKHLARMSSRTSLAIAESRDIHLSQVWVTRFPSSASGTHAGCHSRTSLRARQGNSRERTTRHSERQLAQLVVKSIGTTRWSVLVLGERSSSAQARMGHFSWFSRPGRSVLGSRASLLLGSTLGIPSPQKTLRGHRVF